MNRIRLLREERGMTQKELSRLLNVQDAAISKYENGKILLTEDTIVFLANYFGVSTDYLLGITDKPSCDKDIGWRFSTYEDKATWLFDLAHGNLNVDAIVKGFLKHYALQNQTINNVQQDLHFHTLYGDFHMEAAMSGLRRALELQIEATPRSEM